MQRMMQGSTGDRAVNYKKYDKLLKDLERDSVDTDILDEELKRLQETEPRTCRGRTAKLIESSPLHVTICILILIDVAIVTTQILMDMHSMRSQYLEATNDLLEVSDYLRATNPDVLGSYDGESIGYILEAVRSKSARSEANNTEQRQKYLRESASRLIEWLRVTDLDSLLSNRRENASTISSVCSSNCSVLFKETLLVSLASNFLRPPSRIDNDKESAFSELPPNDGTQHEEPDNSTVWIRDLHAACSKENRHVEAGVSTKTIQKASHIMHYIGIGIVGLFALQVFVKMYALGLDFFRQKMEVFDGIITLTSFGVDVVTLEGVSATQSEETIAVLVVFLLWRVLRLANALMVAAKQRQEFRIKLQKRGRQRSDKKIEWLESDLTSKKREIDLLVRLCIERGATDEEINVCRPKNNFPKLNASAGLSSVASFSLGLSMSMRGACDDPTNQAGIRRITTVTNSRKQSFQDLFPVRPAAPHHHRNEQSPGTPASATVASSSSTTTTTTAATSCSTSKKPARLSWSGGGGQKTSPPESHQLLVSSSVSASPMEEISEEERSGTREETVLDCITIDFTTFDGDPDDENEAYSYQNEVLLSPDMIYASEHEIPFISCKARLSQGEARFSQNEADSSRNEACVVCLNVSPLGLSQNEVHFSHNEALAPLKPVSLSIPSILLPEVGGHVVRSEPEMSLVRQSSVAVISGLYESAGVTDDGCYRNSVCSPVCSPVSPDAEDRCLSSQVQCAPHRPFHGETLANSARQYWSRLRQHVIK